MIEEKREREESPQKGTERLEAFSDGVFAVAITLLVIDLKVPQLSGAPTAGELARELASQWASYVAFLISFATILIMWVSHHNLFKLIDKLNTPFMFANGFLLLLVTVVPFPTALVSQYLQSEAATTACVAYSGLFVFISIAYNILWWSAAYRHHLLRADITPAFIRSRTFSYGLGFPSYLVAVVIAFWSPAISIGICSVLWLFWAFTNF